MPMPDDDMMGLLPEEKALLEANQQIAASLQEIVQTLGQVAQALVMHAQASSQPRARRIIRGPDGKAQGSVEEPA
jgi:hypothetical protein